MPNDIANNITDTIHQLEKELKDLREENKVLIRECDRLIKEKGELLNKVSGGDVLRIRQLEEQLEKAKLREYKIYDLLADTFGCPCNFSPLDEYMLENGGCDDCCGTISDEECWSRYIQTKLIGDETDEKP